MEGHQEGGVRTIVPGQRNLLATATLVLTIATVVFYGGYLAMVFGLMITKATQTQTAGLCVMLVGALIYIPGLMVYRRSSDKPYFVGYVVGALQQPPQQLGTAYAMPVGPSEFSLAAQPPPSYDDAKKQWTS